MNELAVTRVAHATVLIDFGGHPTLIDPWFSQRFTYYQGEPLGISLNALPELAGVIVRRGYACSGAIHCASIEASAEVTGAMNCPAT